ncbi:MAG TPA: hypothetical protein VFL91_31185 [Thermomicrobiales bacterium]|nr:hypothetical protein [Thermomicrobiales bacterium]
MDPVEAPLQWWAAGGYAEVARELARTRRPDDPPVTPLSCRRLVHRLIRDRYRATGDATWRPRGHRGYEELRRKLRENRALDHDLV